MEWELVMIIVLADLMNNFQSNDILIIVLQVANVDYVGLLPFTLGGLFHIYNMHDTRDDLILHSNWTIRWTYQPPRVSTLQVLRPSMIG